MFGYYDVLENIPEILYSASASHIMFHYYNDEEMRWSPPLTPRLPRIYVAKNLEAKEACSNLDLSISNEKCPLLTDDQVPVRKILVANISQPTTHKTLKFVFEDYGEIIDCILKKKSLQKNYAFITFKTSESAHRAICDGYHKNINVDGQYLRVLPAAAWHQPDKSKYTNVTTTKLADRDQYELSAYNSYLSNDESPITKLNEYCLLQIFGLLSIREGIKIQRVCRYWQIISTQSMILNKKYDSLLRSDNWEYIQNAATLYKVLKKFGSYVTRVEPTFQPLGNSTLIAIAELCPNLEDINLSYFPFLTSGIKALANNCTKIKRILIGKSTHTLCENQLLDKELSALFSKNRKIQYLTLMGNVINGSCLKHLSTKYITHISLKKLDCSLYIQIICKIQNLFTLEIYYCYNEDKLLQGYIQGYKGLKLNAEKIEKLTMKRVPDQLLYSFFKFCNLKNLKYLNLSWLKNDISDESLLVLSENCSQLKYIDISGAKRLTNRGLIYIVTSLPKLEYLRMSKMSLKVTDEIFYCGMPSLKSLDCSNCLKMKDEGLIKLVNNSEKLEELVVRSCRLITNKLIHEVVKCTKRRENKILLTIHVGYTQISFRDFKDNSDFLKLIHNFELIENNPKL